MCPPDYFGIEYEINAWMHKSERVELARAKEEWRELHDIYTKKLGWKVELVDPVEHLPDMVFATDSCLMIGGKILLSNFRCKERQPEAAHFERWLREHGYGKIKKAKHYIEGGDNLLCGDKILAGYGFRSDAETANEMRQYFGLEVVPVRLVDPYFYHLDTSVAVLDTDTVAVYPPAIDEASQKRLRAAIPNVIEISLKEASSFGLNAVSDGQTVVTSNASESLLAKYRDAGFDVIGTPILEFRKSGGGVKCMTLELRA